jgi:hypothetical protein
MSKTNKQTKLSLYSFTANCVVYQTSIYLYGENNGKKPQEQFTLQQRGYRYENRFFAEYR